MITPESLTYEELTALWTQAADELLGFSKNLECRGMQITADQLRLAVAMANRYHEALGKALDANQKADK